jgi:hypothetical protein
VYRRYRCKACLRTFNDKSGTDFEYSRIPLNERLFIMYLSRCLIVPLLKASIDVGYTDYSGIMYAVDEVYVNAGLKGRSETAARIASRHIEAGSRIYTDNFP